LRHKNDTTRKENIYLNTTTNNFLKGANFNYSCIFGGCRQDYVMSKVHTENSMPNIPSCFTLVTLKAKNAIPITSYCKALN
jgi:hypothetical protein